MVLRHDVGQLGRTGGTQALGSDTGVIDVDLVPPREPGARP
jgi:hypothetical protein